MMPYNTFEYTIPLDPYIGFVKKLQYPNKPF